MAAPTSTWLGDPAGAAGTVGEIRLTVEQFAGEVGMSTRNIRAHQARGLLPPPRHEGRRAFYDASHVKRARVIQDLQRNGFNLAAITSMLVDAGADARRDGVLRIVAHVRMAAPAVADRLAAHGVLAPDHDGGVRLNRANALHAALALREVGVPTLTSVRIVADLLDAVHDHGQEAVRAAARSALATSGSARGAGELSAMAVENALTSAVVEAFRLVAENLSRTAVRALIDDHAAPRLVADDDLVLDVG